MAHTVIPPPDTFQQTHLKRLFFFKFFSTSSRNSFYYCFSYMVRIRNDGMRCDDGMQHASSPAQEEWKCHYSDEEHFGTYMQACTCMQTNMHTNMHTNLLCYTHDCARAECPVLMPEYVYIYSKCTTLVKKRTHTLFLWPFLVSVARIKERCTDRFVLRWRMLAIAFAVTLHRGKDPTVRRHDFSKECVVHIFRGWGVIWYVFVL